MSATVSKIAKAFPKALPNSELLSKATATLAKAGFTNSNTLVATSLCCDELSRPLETCFDKAYGDHFSMGGLSGFPWGGVTSFGAMAAHIPDGGHCLLCYGPHVGVDSTGKVGTVERRGRANGGACCGSANAACGHVLSVMKGEKTGGLTISNPQDAADAHLTFVDAQQAMVGELLLPEASRLAAAEDVQVELPYALLDVQRKMIEAIVGKAAGAVASPGMIAVMGGIQINTPPDMEDYFMPAHFDLYNNKGEKVDELAM
jgi:hypothetical protein